jgi:hypothetical protein
MFSNNFPQITFIITLLLIVISELNVVNYCGFMRWTAVNNTMTENLLHCFCKCLAAEGYSANSLAGQIYFLGVKPPTPSDET